MQYFLKGLFINYELSFKIYFLLLKKKKKLLIQFQLNLY